MAEVKLTNPFSDNMVLQHELPAPIFGTAAPGEEFSVTFDGQTPEYRLNYVRRYELFRFGLLRVSQRGLRTTRTCVGYSGASGINSAMENDQKKGFYTD